MIIVLKITIHKEVRTVNLIGKAFSCREKRCRIVADTVRVYNQISVENNNIFLTINTNDTIMIL